MKKNRPERYFYDCEIISAMDVIILYYRLFRNELSDVQCKAFIEVYNSLVDELIERDVFIE